VAAGQGGSEHDPVHDELLAYLREHPNAMDTLKGIAEWWLPRHRVRVEVERVAEALRRLEASGLIERIGAEDCPLYRLRQHPVNAPDDFEPREKG
jgi:DNA-binding Lrp family transcriptional regulator